MTKEKKTPAKQPKDAPQRQAKTGAEGDPFLVRALARGLTILGLFDVDHREWTIDDMAEKTGLLRMTVYRMARTLESLAFLIRDPVTNRYRLGPAILAMNYVSEDHSGLLDMTRPYLESLVEETGESVTLAIEVDGIPVCVDMINTTRPFTRKTAPGRIIGDVTSVPGKIFAAYRPDSEDDSVLSRILTIPPAEAPADPGLLEREFETIRRDHVAFDLEGLYTGLCAVGSPVMDQLGKVVAAIAVVVPTGRFGPEEREHCTESVKSTALALSAYLGWNQETGTIH
jgi:IclR family pca regulon transcriptional regulator